MSATRRPVLASGKGGQMNGNIQSLWQAQGQASTAWGHGTHSCVCNLHDHNRYCCEHRSDACSANREWAHSIMANAIRPKPRSCHRCDRGSQSCSQRKLSALAKVVEPRTAGRKPSRPSRRPRWSPTQEVQSQQTSASSVVSSSGRLPKCLQQLIRNFHLVLARQPKAHPTPPGF